MYLDMILDQIHIDLFYHYSFFFPPKVYTSSHKTYAMVSPNITTWTAFLLIFSSIKYLENYVLTRRPSTTRFCVNALPYNTAALNHKALDNWVLDNSLLYNLIHYNSSVENYVVLNNTPLHDSALYKSVLDDSVLGNMVEINFSQDNSPQASA